MKHNTTLKVGIVLAIGAMMISGCGGIGAAKTNMNAVLSAPNQQFIQSQMHISVSGNGANYSDSTPNSSLIVKMGLSYVLNLQVQNAAAGASYSIQATNLDDVNPTPINLNVAVGNNTISFPAKGNYQIKLMASAAGLGSQSKIYQAEVQCANPSFSQASLASVNLSVSGNNNSYTFSSSGVAASANGQAPYQCAWDPTGTGIVDTAFGPCDASLGPVYGNYVLSRNIGLVVRDACNTSYTVSKPLNLAYSEPAMGAGNVFIQGVLSNAGGTAVGDKRVDGVTYYAQNTATNKIVSSQYGNGAFTIFAWQNYNMGSSVNFGMQIKVSGLVETTKLDAATGAGAVDASNAKIASVTYVTDQAGDQASSMSFSGKNCTLSNQGAKVLPVSGQPCTGGTSGNQNALTVEVWGHYSCTGLVASDASTDIQGDFDGYYNIADSCSGGGQGGGGVPPPNF
jgi:hypothetical protein